MKRPLPFLSSKDEEAKLEIQCAKIFVVTSGGQDVKHNRSIPKKGQMHERCGAMLFV